jgi:hypothetical protein
MLQWKLYFLTVRRVDCIFKSFAVKETSFAFPSNILIHHGFIHRCESSRGVDPAVIWKTISLKCPLHGCDVDCYPPGNFDDFYLCILPSAPCTAVMSTATPLETSMISTCATTLFWLWNLAQSVLGTAPSTTVPECCDWSKSATQLLRPQASHLCQGLDTTEEEEGFIDCMISDPCLMLSELLVATWTELTLVRHPKIQYLEHLKDSCLHLIWYLQTL